MAAFPGETFLQHIRGAYHWIAQEFEYLYSQLQGYLSAEHKDDGRHSDVTADTIATGKLSITSPDWFIRLFHSQAPKTKLLEWRSDKPATTRHVAVEMAAATRLEVRFPYASTQSSVTFIDLFQDQPLALRGGRRAGIVFDGTGATETKWTLGIERGAFSNTGQGLGFYDWVPGNDAATKYVFGITKDPNIAAGGAGKYLVMPAAQLSDSAPVYLGHREFAGGTLWESVEGRLLYGLNGVQERGRTVAMGEWIAVAFSAANFYGAAGGSWTVGAPAVLHNRYTLVGKTMTWAIYVSWYSGSNLIGGPVSALGLRIPGGYTGLGGMLLEVAFGMDGDTVTRIEFDAQVIGTEIRLTRPGGALIGQTPSYSPGFAATFTFEVQ